MGIALAGDTRRHRRSDVAVGLVGCTRDRGKMAARWQQWMPFHIDRFKASPAVQAMHPAARSGYLYLLSCQWQSDDGTISNDTFELAENSGLGDELWAVYGPRILRNFDSAGPGKLRNQVCHEEWVDAKRVFEARRQAADRTNNRRSPLRPADTQTTVVPVDVPVPVPPEENNGRDLLEPAMLARCLGETLGLSIGYGPGSLNTAVTEVAEVELRAGRDLRDVAVEMEAAYRYYLQEKPKLRIHWGPTKFFGEGHWRDPRGWPRKAEHEDKDVYQRFMESDA